MEPSVSAVSPSGTHAPDDECLKAALASINGLDIEAGLYVVRGKLPRYVNLLRLFMQCEADTLKKIRAALDAGRLDDAQSIAHALKGVAGNVGATRVHELAETMNSAIRRGIPDAEAVSREAFKALELALPQLLDDLQRALPSLSPSGSANP